MFLVFFEYVLFTRKVVLVHQRGGGSGKARNGCEVCHCCIAQALIWPGRGSAATYFKRFQHGETKTLRTLSSFPGVRATLK